MNSNKLINILQSKDIRVYNNNVKLEDLLTKVIAVKNVDTYIKRNIKEYEERNGYRYMTLERCYELLNKTNRKEAKDILNELNINDAEVNNGILIDINNNKFKYNGKEIMIIKHNNKIWFKGKNIAEILEYEDTEQAIREHVNDNDKQKYDFFTPVIFTGQKQQDKKTIFINESGLYSLVLSSKKLEAKIFKRWITKDVLPALREHGVYVMPQAVNFYENNMISDYDNKNVIYIGDIGIYDNVHLYKFGKTANIYTRDYNQHKKLFEQFNIIHICECDNKDNVEQIFKKELQSKQLLRELTVNQKKQTELFTTNVTYNITVIIKMLTDLINKYPLQAIADKEREHKEILLKNEYDKDVLIEREHTKQEQERTRQKEIEIKLLVKQRELELQIKLAEIKIYEEQYKLKLLEMKMLDNKNTQSLTENNIISPYSKFTNKYIQQTNNKNDYIVWTELKQQYKQWYVDNYDDNILNTKDIKKLFEENIFKCAENKYHINDTYFRGWINHKLINND